MPCVPVECAGSVFASGTRETNALRAPVPPQSSHANRCHRVSSREVTAALAQYLYCAGQAVESALTGIQREALAKDYGTKGITLLSALGSLRFPQSFCTNSCIWSGKILPRTSSSSGLSTARKWMKLNHTSSTYLGGC